MKILKRRVRFFLSDAIEKSCNLEEIQIRSEYIKGYIDCMQANGHMTVSTYNRYCFLLIGFTHEERIISFRGYNGE